MVKGLESFGLFINYIVKNLLTFKYFFEIIKNIGGIQNGRYNNG